MLELEKIAFRKNTDNGGSIRQLRVSEMIKQVVAEIFAQQQIIDKVLSEYFITVNRVKMSADLQYAHIYVSAFNVADSSLLIARLNQLAPKFRAMIAPHIKLKFLPKIVFYYDDTIANAQRIANLLDMVKEE